MQNKRKVIFVAMSGGVDSSVAAALLKKKGFDVVGVFMRCVNLDGCAERDAEDARRVAAYLNIPFYVFEFEKEYQKKVVSYLIDGYRSGITPNPDVMCNKEIKFGLFLKKALALGAKAIATGHYVRLSKFGGKPMLKVARDLSKDQSYFLWTLTPDILSRCYFPLGSYTKPEVRNMARKWGLPTANKKDSQGICFLGKVSLREFLSKHLGEQEGLIVTTDGKVLSKHRGAWFYTVGQRHIGTSLQVDRESAGEPWYVARKDVRTNTLVVAQGSENPALKRKVVRLTDTCFYAKTLFNGDCAEIWARVRYRQSVKKASLIKKERGYELIFSEPQKFIAPGQSAVFYSRAGLVLGGGVIV